jgi:hypothetical protein
MSKERGLYQNKESCTLPIRVRLRTLAWVFSQFIDDDLPPTILDMVGATVWQVKSAEQSVFGMGAIANAEFRQNYGSSLFYSAG